jgi:PleD family two-component response regulator
LTAGIDVGGDDYLTKPAPTQVLADKIKAMARLYEFRARLHNTTRSLQKTKLELLRLTTIDGLTGIVNRCCPDEALRVE